MEKFISEKYRDDYLEYFGKNARKFLLQRVVFGLIMLIVVAAAGIMFGKLWIILVSPIGGFIGYKFPYIQLVKDKAHDDMLKSFIFPQFLRYFIALIGTQGNVYQTLVATVSYMGGEVGRKLEEFIAKIEIDNNHEYYTDFAEYIGTNESHMVMSMLYDFSEKGVVKEELEELERTIDKLNENKTNQMVQFKTDEQEKYMNTPIFSSIFFVMSFAAVIVVKNVLEISKYLAF